MAATIPASCGGSDDNEKPKTPDNPVNPDKPQDKASAPTITILMQEACVLGGAKVEKADCLLLIGSDTVASWSTGGSPIKNVTLTYNGSDISFGTLLSEKGTLSLSVYNEADKSSVGIITLTDEAIMGLSSLSLLPLQVDQEADLLQGLALAKGFELAKTEMELDGQRTEIADASHFTPQYPGTCNLFFTVRRNNIENEIKAENLTIKPLDYRAIEINHIKPVDILPII